MKDGRKADGPASLLAQFKDREKERNSSGRPSTCVLGTLGDWLVKEEHGHLDTRVGERR